MKRAVRIINKDGTFTDLELVKATSIHADIGMLHLDKLDKGWRLIFSDYISKDFSQIDRLEIIREEDE